MVEYNMQRCFKCKLDIKTSNADIKYGLHKECFNNWFNLPPNLPSRLDDFQDIYTPKAFEASAIQGLHNTTLYHGKFEKISAKLQNRKYLLKTSKEYPELARTEYLCNQLGIVVGLDIPAHYLITWHDGKDWFVTYDFIQDYTRADLKHIYHFIEPGKYKLEEVLKVIENKTNRITEIRKFINLCLFDGLIGNNDRHGRNLALIVRNEGNVLSPCYDNVSNFAITDESFLECNLSPRGAITTSATSEPMLEDYIIEFIKLGYRTEVTNFLNQLDIAKITFLIDDSFLSKKRKLAFTNFVNIQYQKALCRIK